jgi:beta-lactamase superfamily II metal-dependent hydrolase
MGDAEEASEKEMLEKGFVLESDVLKAGHHGSDSSTSPEFLKAVHPEYAVISVGKDNSYGHPAQETLAQFEENRIQVYRTDEAGTIVAVSDGSTVTFE